MFFWETVAFSPQQSRPSPTKPCLQIQCPPTQWASRSQCRHSSVNTTRIRFSNIVASNVKPQLISPIKIERVAHCWQRAFASHLCFSHRVPTSMPFVGCVCRCFSPLPREVYFRVPLLKNQQFQIPVLTTDSRLLIEFCDRFTRRGFTFVKIILYVLVLKPWHQNRPTGRHDSTNFWWSVLKVKWNAYRVHSWFFLSVIATSL